MVDYYKTLKWRRASEIYDQKKLRVFPKEGNIKPRSIQTGRLSDSYFTSIVDALTLTSPGAIEDLFMTKEIEPKGIYCIKIFNDGEV